MVIRYGQLGEDFVEVEGSVWGLYSERGLRQELRKGEAPEYAMNMTRYYASEGVMFAWCGDLICQYDDLF